MHLKIIFIELCICSLYLFYLFELKICLFDFVFTLMNKLILCTCKTLPITQIIESNVVVLSIYSVRYPTEWLLGSRSLTV